MQHRNINKTKTHTHSVVTIVFSQVPTGADKKEHLWDNWKRNKADITRKIVDEANLSLSWAWTWGARSRACYYAERGSRCLTPTERCRMTRRWSHNPCISAGHMTYTPPSLTVTLHQTSGQSNLTKGRITLAHESLNRLQPETFRLNGFKIKRFAHPYSSISLRHKSALGLVSWNLTFLFRTNMAISETNVKACAIFRDQRKRALHWLKRETV